MSLETLRDAIAREMRDRPPRAHTARSGPAPDGAAHEPLPADGPAATAQPAAASPVDRAAAGATPAAPVPMSPVKQRLESLPLLGKLAWWVHALFKAPARIRDLNTLRHLDLAARERAFDDLRAQAAALGDATRQARAGSRALANDIDGLSLRLDELAGGLGQQAAALAAEARRRGDGDQRLATVQDRVAGLARAVEDGLQQASAATRTLEDRLGAETAALSRRQDGLSTALQRAETALGDVETAVGELRESVDAGARRLVELADSSARRARQADGLATRLDAVRTHLALPDRPPAPGAMDGFFQDLEHRFRGAAEVIRERQAVYLPVVRDAGAGTAERPVLDLGSGRGEWLSNLREAGLVGCGVDSNARVVDQCRSTGLDVVHGHLLAFLEDRESESVGAVTAFQVAEHLAFESVFRLVEEAHRVLGPGGVVILETPNPSNLLVAANWFHLDPSHRSLIPRELLGFLLEQRGFERTETRELHPVTEADVPGDDNPLGSFLSGPQDYAVIGWKPGSVRSR